MAISKRLLSIDVFRAVTMLLMIFVNDVSGVHHLPAWVDHAGAEEDRLGFADTIFPAFLFIVGLSLPHAIQNRLQKGKNTVQNLWYIIGRSAALIMMGFYHVNLESYSDESLLLRPVWTILVTIAFFLIWLQYPTSLSKAIKYTLKTSGILLLSGMAVVYKGGEAGHLHGMESSWWGILGIIGWAYLVRSFIFILLNGQLNACFIAFLVLLLINISTHTGMMPFPINIVGDASSATLIMAGVVASLIYTRTTAENKKRKWLLLTGAFILLLAGFIVRPFAGGISKIYATPAWVLICAGISLFVFLLFSWLIDIKGKYALFKIIQPAGTSTLICYLLPYIWYSFFELTGFWYPAYFNAGLPGIFRSFAVAFIMIGVAGLLEKQSIRLKV